MFNQYAVTKIERTRKDGGWYVFWQFVRGCIIQ